MNGRRAGFTLVELVVAIGIVVLLAGLTLSVSVKVIEASEARETETTLRLLDQAVKQWEVAADRKLTWWDDVYDKNRTELRDRSDIHGDTPPVLIITELLNVIGRSTEVQSVLAQINPALVTRYADQSYPQWIQTHEEKTYLDDSDGAITILDAWGTPIYATHPGRVHDLTRYPHLPPPLYPPIADPDGTIRTYNERDYGIAPNRQIVFVSAGPDRRFGRLEEFMHLQGMARHEAINEARRDNLFTASVSYN